MSAPITIINYLSYWSLTDVFLNCDTEDAVWKPHRLDPKPPSVCRSPALCTSHWHFLPALLASPLLSTLSACSELEPACGGGRGVTPISGQFPRSDLALTWFVFGTYIEFHREQIGCLWEFVPFRSLQNTLEVFDACRPPPGSRDGCDLEGP